VIEGLAGPGSSNANNFESLFSQPWRDAEGVDFDPATGLVTFVFSTGATGTPRIVVFESAVDVPPPAPEPAALLLLAPLAALLARRVRA